METFNLRQLLMLPKGNLITSLEDGIFLFENLDRNYDINDAIKEDCTVNEILPFNNFFNITFIAIALCRQGYMRVKINMTEYEIRQNDMIYIIPGSTGYIGETIQVSSNCKLMVLALDQENFGPVIPTDAIAAHGEHILQSGKIHLDDSGIENIMTTFSLLRKRISNDSYIYKKEAARCLIQLFFFDMVNINPTKEYEKKGITSRKKHIFNMFMNLLKDNYKKERRLSFYADRLCMTPKYMSRIIFEVSGQHAIDWIRYYTIAGAKILLRSGEYTAQQVSEMLNFPNSSFFGTYFRKATGYSPKKYMEHSVPYRLKPGDTESSSDTTSA